jgi:hypothetical protein
MGATYTRQSSYTDGDVITAAHTNDEFDQLLAAFQASSGHTHDGTANEGGPITKLLGNTLTFGAGTAGTDITITFDGETSDGVLKWMEDEDYFEFSDDILVASTEKLQFRDTAIYINSSTDGQLDLVADTEIQIAATTIDINGNADVSGTLTYGSLSDGSITITAFVDEDDMSSNSATLVPTQQSVKAYVDTQITAEDLDFQADSGGALSIDLDSETLTFTGGTGIDTSGSGNAVTFAIDSTVATLTGSQSLTNKTIDVDNNTVSNIEVDNFKASAIVLESEGIGSNDNDTTIPTSAAVKDYVDTQITAEDLDVTSDSGTIAIDLDSETLTIAGGEGIDTSATSNTVTIAGEDASTSNKGIASFSSDNFAVSSGAVTIKDGGVVTAELAADAVTGAKIADDAIDSEHYTDGSIDTAHLGDLQVTTAKIAADAITGAKIADDAINSEHYTDGSIDTAHIGDLQVTTAKIAADAITGAKIADDAIDSEHYTDGSIDTAHIADSQVTTAKIAADAITEAKIADNAVESEHINDNVISGQTELASGLATTDELLVSDAGTIKRMDVSVLTALTDDNATALAIALG